MISGFHGPPTPAWQGLRGFTWLWFVANESLVKSLASPTLSELYQ